MFRQAQHEREGLKYPLVCHPDTPAKQVRSVTVEWTANDATEVLLTFVVEGSGALVVPERTSPSRADELWRTTCFEMFWQPAGEGAYVELNFSPSSRWATYAFDGYRSGMRNQAMATDPVIETAAAQSFSLEVGVDFATFTGSAARIGLSAVIEETGGTKSYWALRHPPGAPDFHHPDCFALELPALGAP